MYIYFSETGPLVAQAGLELGLLKNSDLELGLLKNSDLELLTIPPTSVFPEQG